MRRLAIRTFQTGKLKFTKCKPLFHYTTLYFTLKLILDFCMKERLFDEAQLSVVHFRIKVVVEVVENKQRSHAVDEAERADNHANDEEDPECSSCHRSVGGGQN